MGFRRRRVYKQLCATIVALSIGVQPMHAAAQVRSQPTGGATTSSPRTGAPAARAAGPALAVTVPDLASMMLGFSNGLIPDLNSASQRRLFELYIENYFLGNADDATPERFQELAETLTLDGRFAKERLGSVDVRYLQRISQSPPELAALASELVRTYGQLKALFLRPFANSGLWGRLKISGQRVFSDEQIQRLLTALGPDMAEVGVAPDEIFSRYKSFFEREQVDRDVRGQLLASLAHALSMSDTETQSALRSQDARITFAAIENLLEARASTFARLVAPEFDADAILARGQLVTKIVLPATGSLRARLADARRASEGRPSTSVARHYRIRPLSSAESPFRSCTAHDCATRSYFTRALDPDYYYLTLTNEEGHSRGHITIVLGEAREGSQTKRIAMVDKVQMIDVADLPEAFEAARLIVAEAGYELAVPQDVGDINGISNDESHRVAIKRLPAVREQRRRLRSFRSDPSTPVYGPNEHSRADANLVVIPLLPLRQEQNQPRSFTLHPPQRERVAVGMADLWTMIGATFRLREGTPAEKQQYIELMERLALAGMPTEPGLESILVGMARDARNPLAVRNRAMKAILYVAPRLLPETWSGFSQGELVTLLQNWSQAESTRSRLTWAAWTALPYAGANLAFLRPYMRMKFSDDAFAFVAQAARSPVTLAKARELSDADRAIRAREVDASLIETFVALEAAHRAKAARASEAVVTELEMRALEMFVELMKADSRAEANSHLEVALRFAELVHASEFNLNLEPLREMLTREVKKTGPTMTWLKLKRFSPAILGVVGATAVFGSLVLVSMSRYGELDTPGLVLLGSGFATLMGAAFTVDQSWRNNQRLATVRARLETLSRSLAAHAAAVTERERLASQAAPAPSVGSGARSCRAFFASPAGAGGR